jgi:hypothetical protein
MDGAAFIPCSSSPTYSDLGEGGHSFSVIAVDPAGNKSSSTTADFTVDTIEPGGATITSGPSGHINNDDVSFEFTSGDPTDHFECSLDGAAYVTCTSAQSYIGLTDGDHTFDVRAVDDAGNAGSSTTRDFTVDTVGPQETTIESGPSGNVSTDSVTFELSSDDSTATFECSLDGAAFTPCDSSTNYSGLSQGGHTFSVRAVDPAGNSGPEATADFIVDTIAPGTVTISAGPTDRIRTDDVSFEFTSGDATDHFECSLDGGAFTTCTSPANYNNLDDGTHTFEVRAVDEAGNVGAGTVVVFEVDTPSSGSGSSSDPDPTPSPSGSVSPTPEPSPSPTGAEPTPSGSQNGGKGGGGKDKPEPDPEPAAPAPDEETSEAPAWSPPADVARVTPGTGLVAEESAPSSTDTSKAPKRHAVRIESTADRDAEVDAPKVKKSKERRLLRTADKKVADRPLPLWINNAAETVKTFSFPFVLALLVLLYLMTQHWIDRKTPKLAMAPINARFDIVRFR